MTEEEAMKYGATFYTHWVERQTALNDWREQQAVEKGKAMTIKELIEELSAHPPEMEVLFEACTDQDEASYENFRLLQKRVAWVNGLGEMECGEGRLVIALVRC